MTMTQLLKRFSRDITGLIWLSTGIFLALALATYHPTDPSLDSIGSHLLPVQNACGYFGSYLADILYQLLGFTAWFIVFASLRQAWRNFLGEEIRSSRIRGLWICLFLLTVSSLSALYLPDKRYFSGQILASGILGKIIKNSLVKVFNPTGVAVILWTLALIWIVFYTEKSLGQILKSPKKILHHLYFPLGRATGFGVRALPTIFAKLSKLFETPKILTESVVVKSSLNRAEPFLPIVKSEDSEPIQEAQVAQIEAPAEAPKRRLISLKRPVPTRVENWDLPKLSMLEDPPYDRKKVDEREIRDKAQRLLNKLKHFGISGEVVGAKPGPAVTLFEFKPNADVKISRITDLADDLSLELSSESVRIIAPIPGRDVVGIETSNSSRETVYLKEILATEEFWDEKIALPLTLGCEADGSQKVVDLRKMPHLLVAGTTGSGKSVFVVSMLTGLLFRHSPKTLKLILIDPKQVDLASFSKVPHLLMPPIREPKKAINALRWAIREMEKRYRSMAKFGARDLESFNRAVGKLNAAQVGEHEQINQEFESALKANQTYYFSTQPYTIIVVEEFGDLMAVDKSNVETCVVRLAQMARACGIHLILAMQSPRRDVVTGLIKTNIPGRVSFKVASKMDSRIILDESGAERLLSRGDMLFLAPGVSKPLRHHGPWVTDSEIQSVCQFWTNQAEPEFDPTAMRALDGAPASKEGLDSDEELPFDGADDDFDERYDEILAYVSTQKEISASHIQTRFRLGYPRAARLIEVFESQGVVGPANGSKKRQVLVSELK